MNIGEIAKACGVSRDTIRHYEQKGLIGAIERDRSGYRCYSPATIDRVRVIRRALSIGFTLDELARIFRQRASGTPPCRQVRELASQKLDDIDEQIAALTRLRATLCDIAAKWDERLESTAEGAMAHLLDSLIE